MGVEFGPIPSGGSGMELPGLPTGGNQFVFYPGTLWVKGTWDCSRLGSWCLHGRSWLQSGILGRGLVLVGRSWRLQWERFWVIPKGGYLRVLSDLMLEMFWMWKETIVSTWPFGIASATLFAASGWCLLTQVWALGQEFGHGRE